MQAAAQTKQIAQRQHMQAFIDRFRYKARKARQAQSRIKMLARMEPIIAVDRGAAPSTFDFPAGRAGAALISRSTTSRPAMMGKPVCATSICASTWTTASRCSAPTATANRRWSSCSPAACSRWPASSGASPKLRVGYFAQHQTEELDLGTTPLQHSWQQLAPLAIEEKLRAHLGRFGFSGEKALTQVGALSGGEKARLLFALMTRSRRISAAGRADQPSRHRFARGAGPGDQRV